MKVSDICEAAQALAPLSFAESWDKVGLLVGAYDAPVSRILLTLDVTSEALLLAERLGSEMICCHHPLIFQPLTHLRNEPPLHHLLHKIVRRGLAVYAAHTNLDSCLGGVNDALAAVLELEAYATLLPLSEGQQATQKQLALTNPYLQKQGLHPDLVAGMGRLARPREGKIHAKAFVRRVNNNLQTTGCHLNFDTDKRYERLLVWGGAFDATAIPACLQAQVDCIVAGEIKHHDLVALAELGIHAIAAGHDATERVVLGPWMAYLKEVLPDCRFAVYTGLTYNNLVY